MRDQVIASWVQRCTRTADKTTNPARLLTRLAKHLMWLEDHWIRLEYCPYLPNFFPHSRHFKLDAAAGLESADGSPLVGSRQPCQLTYCKQGRALGIYCMLAGDGSDERRVGKECIPRGTWSTLNNRPCVSNSAAVECAIKS